ncbi:MAG TPA: hypothetical protein VF761_14135 [Gemmatimonadaceae bacterium]
MVRQSATAAGTAPADARERFLREIVAKIPPERVSELHLFAPLRQGGIETGVAVVAVAGEGESPKHTVYTATYRLTLKGPDRGKWESALNAEADAPLLTVDAVVRGVQRRAGDEGEPERLRTEELIPFAPEAGSPGA